MLPKKERRRLDRHWEENVHAFVDLCLDVTTAETGQDMARRTGLCAGTIYRLRSGKFSCRIQARTYLAIGRAAGFELINKNGAPRVIRCAVEAPEETPHVKT